MAANICMRTAFSVAPQNRFYFQVLLYPFKEQFYCLSVFIEQGNLGSCDIHVVGQEDKYPFGFTVVELYSTYLFGDNPERYNNW